MNVTMRNSPQDLIAFLKDRGIQRFYVVYDRDKQELRASHPELKFLVDFLRQDTRDYANHEGLFVQVSKKFSVLHGAFIHRTCRGQAAGGSRFWSYDTIEDFFRDGIRLSKGMTHKSALAGLWWGGGKGVIARDPKVDFKNPETRKQVFQEYGDFVTSLRGCYITAEDVGTVTEDIGNIFSRSRFVICIPEEVGGSGNPSAKTAEGVVRGMESALAAQSGSTLAGKTVAVQGLGNVGRFMVQFLFERGVKSVVASDISGDVVQQALKQFQGKAFEASVVEKGDHSVLFSAVDLVAPCATGGTLNEKTIPLLRTKIVCGAANNQLEDPDKDDRRLLERGILYVPDFLVNRMGIVYCANEQYGYVTQDPAIDQHMSDDWEFSIYRMTQKVIELSRKQNKPTGQAAIELAEQLSTSLHPIFGHRGQKIIDSLVKDVWQRKI